MMIISRVAITSGGKNAQMRGELTVGIQPALKRIKALGRRRTILGKGFYVIITHIAADTPSPVKTEILTYTIEESAGKALVKPHVMRSEADDVIGTAITETSRDIHLCRSAAIDHHLYAGLRIDIHQPNLMGYGVPAVINKPNLNSMLVTHTNIDNTQLRAVERIGIIIGGKLPSAGLRGTYIHHSGYLYSLVHSHRYIGDATNLHARKPVASNIAETRQLQAMQRLGGVGHPRELDAAQIARRHIDHARQLSAIHILPRDIGQSTELNTIDITTHTIGNTGHLKTVGISTGKPDKPRKITTAHGLVNRGRQNTELKSAQSIDITEYPHIEITGAYAVVMTAG